MSNEPAIDGSVEAKVSTSDTEHTPGPWAVQIVSCEDDMAIVAMVDGVETELVNAVHAEFSGLSLETTRANITLMASALDMRDALLAQDEAREHWHACPDCDSHEVCDEGRRLDRRATDMRRAALDKSKGKVPA